MGAGTVLDRLAGYGVRSALDDFGVGYASLAHLRTLAVDEVKIDRGFVAGVEGNEADREVVRSLVALAHGLGLTVTAEGVETAEAADWLTGVGCDAAQGYWYARPTRWEELLDHPVLGPRCPHLVGGHAVNRPVLLVVTGRRPPGGRAVAPADPGSEAGAAPARPAVDPALHAALPADVRARGELRVVTEAAYAPASSFAPDGRTIVGFEPDLGVALGDVLGVRVTFSHHPFDELPRLVGSGAADLIMSAMTDTSSRRAELDFVDYFSAGTSIVVQRGNPAGITQLDSLCGARVAVQRGTVQVDLLTALQARCTSPLQVLQTRDNDEALLELRTGPPRCSTTTHRRWRSPRRRAPARCSSSPRRRSTSPACTASPSPRSSSCVTPAGHAETMVASGAYEEVLENWTSPTVIRACR